MCEQTFNADDAALLALAIGGNEMNGVLGPQFCTVRLYWARDNLGPLLEDLKF